MSEVNGRLRIAHSDSNHPRGPFRLDVLVDDEPVCSLPMVTGYRLDKTSAADGKMGTLSIDFLAVDVEVQYNGYRPRRPIQKRSS